MATLQPTSANAVPEFIPSTRLKNQLGAVLRLATEKNKEIVVQSRGVNKVAIVPFAEYRNLQKLRQNAERKQALAVWQNLRRDIQVRTPGMSEEKAQDLAVRFSRDLVGEVVKKRKKKYG